MKNHSTLFLRTFFLFRVLIAMAFFLSAELSAQIPTPAHTLEKTVFQEAQPWSPSYDIRSDIAIVYYSKMPPLAEKVAGWKRRGYQTHFMTGIAWGNYQDYFMGKFDGKEHWEDGQVEAGGDTIWHGKYVPYVIPSETYIGYIESLVKEAIDAGVTAIHLEEPEIWARAGYGVTFKKEWEKYYGSPWRPQHSSPEATYLSAKLKYHLYYHAIDEVTRYAKKYSASLGRTVQCYIPTHSLINYSKWEIISPEASLASLPAVDGYIAQVWTGTARSENYYDGLVKERVFESAFLEYGSMVAMTAPTGRKMFFLTDPIEDWPRDWDDYKHNYEATFAAQLMYPGVADYEVMPWPGRIYNGKFKLPGVADPQPMPPRYATQVQVMINSLNDMPVCSTTVSGSRGIGVLMSNSLMFQRFPVHDNYADPELSGFFGLALPLLKRGIPVELVHSENLGYPPSLQHITLLLMTYANMKPASAAEHAALAAWVRAGGTLIYVGKDDDPFQKVREWWNTGANQYDAPSQHLFEALGIDPRTTGGEFSCGKGRIIVRRDEPKDIVMQKNGAPDFVTMVKHAYGSGMHAAVFEEKNSLRLERGPYVIAAVMEESVSDQPLKISGSFIDLFDPGLPVISEKIIVPGQQVFLYDLTRVPGGERPLVLCTAARVYNETRKDRRYTFTAKSPSGTMNAMRILLPSRPSAITVTDQAGVQGEHVSDVWDGSSKTLLLTFGNSSDGMNVAISW
jgi:hypothetical protein